MLKIYIEYRKIRNVHKESGWVIYSYRIPVVISFHELRKLLLNFLGQFYSVFESTSGIMVCYIYI